jgi:hypothetical protein
MGLTKIFLDDVRDPPDGDWHVCRSVAEAQQYCRLWGCPAYISFDHDLGANVPSGCDFAHWLVERDLDLAGQFIPPTFGFYVHSANPVGAENIRLLLDPYLKSRR